MKSKTAALLFLVGRGVPQNLAKASIAEVYSGAPEGSDLMYGWDINTDSTDGPPQPIDMPEHAVILMHDIVMDSLSFVHNGIAVDGIKKYDMNGDLIIH